ncbi:hypothetical protein ACF0H5_006734 [Mactra antiquata]
MFGRRMRASAMSDESERIRNRWISVYEEYTGRKIRVVFPKPDPMSDRSVPEPEDKLTVMDIDLEIGKNTIDHHTDDYDITDVLEYDTREMLVVRRGQKFDMKINLNRDYNPKKDDVRLLFKFGKDPLPSHGTHKEFNLSEEDLPNEWGAYITKKGSKSINVSVMTPSTCHVGKWTLHIDVVKEENNERTAYRYAHKFPIYILFNPWCKDDQVYMDDKDLLNEYVLNSTGKIYVGTPKAPYGRPWNFGQFDGNILDCILMLLDDSKLKDRARNDPVLVSRKLSALINSPDDNGVLTGNWSGFYEGGTSPSDWQGSVQILEEYYETKQPVLYGQCWVFSGVLTTACRAIGIPARSVTNFSSAHDTDKNVIIDTYLDVMGEINHRFTGDSVWNFHVWNDVWMTRPDLDAGYDGWQAIDATPQETSDGILCMGPMSLRAIKEGHVNQPYDGKFVFAEVNGDRVYWIRSDNFGEDMLIYYDKNSIGKKISTKYPNRSWREDVTDQYKYPEGTPEADQAVNRACGDTSTRERLAKSVPKDLKFDLTYTEDVIIGQSIDVSVKITNTCSESRVLDGGTLAIYSENNERDKHKMIKTMPIGKETIAPNEEKVLTIMTCTSKEYFPQLFDFSYIRISAIGLVETTLQSIYSTDSFQLQKPGVVITCPDKVKAGDKFEIHVSVENPIDIPLTKCKLKVEGHNSKNKVAFKQDDVKANGIFEGKCELIAGKKKGMKEVIVALICDELMGLQNEKEIEVE